MYSGINAEYMGALGKSHSGKTAGRVAHQVSADGLKWTLVGAWDIGSCDTQPVVFYDEPVKRYAMYTRLWSDRLPAGPKGTWTHSFRMVRRMDTTSLNEDWQNSTVVMAADAVDNSTHPSEDRTRPDIGSRPPVDFYGATVIPDWVGEGTAVYWMLYVRFWHWAAPCNASCNPATFDIALAASRNGYDFARLGERLPFARPSLDGTVGSRMIWPVPTPFLWNDMYWMYVHVGNKNHNGEVDPSASASQSGVALTQLRKDGWVYLEAPYDKAVHITTKPFTMKGSKLTFNVDASGGGALTVELKNASSGAPITGFTHDLCQPITFNVISTIAMWNGTSDVSHLSGIPLLMDLSLQDCNLYSFQFVE
eukprot:NODE_164_length_1186_cov_281.304798_g161_i0.p1 GENE.NODE_164_length_1186_cov_281.304798_g161_i0~~NODE_164_length_1186_cov_281.304798_g161_i0.p1  ORF type:complete len:365 (-),score=49.10 NODE_164_length_1186_cov_281.304798_g161_i0:68-1162(-)